MKELLKQHPALADVLERAGWSAGQAFFATLLAGGAMTSAANVPWKHALIIAAGAAVASAVMTTAQHMANLTDLDFWQDLLARLGKTFLSSLAGTFAATDPFDITAFDWTTALNVAAIATLTALAKGLLARGPVTSQAGENQGVASAANPSTLPTDLYLKAIGSANAPRNQAVNR